MYLLDEGLWSPIKVSELEGYANLDSCPFFSSTGWLSISTFRDY